MDVTKWIPWNWFNKEEETSGKAVPVKHTPSKEQDVALSRSIEQFHTEVDRLFDRAFRGFGLSSIGLVRPMLPRMSEGILKPILDLGATEKDYTVTVEIPGVDEKDVRLEIANDTLTIQGEKKLENEEKGKNYYRVERSYGSFQRTLSLPEDVDQDSVTATYNKGVLSVTMPRKSLPEQDVKQIEVKSA
jgi:HSP20 family protein